MKTIVIPSLGNGWVTDPPLQLNTMFAHALVSDFSQSTLYAGKVTSIAYIVAQYQNNQVEMAAELETALQTYFISVFSIVDVHVTYSPVVDNVYELFISISVTANNQPFSLSASVSVDNGKLLLVVKELN